MRKLFTPTLILLALLSFSIQSNAQSRKKINVDKLQKKYWKAKDYKTGVVQGRKYFKENRFRLGLEYMNLLNDKYSSTDGFDNLRADVSYFINERFSVGGFYENLSLADNTAIKEMAEFNNGQFKLDHVKASSFYGASMEFVPIYSKMSWMNKKIIYFDLSISPKIGIATYEQQLRDQSNPEQTTVMAGLDLAANIFINNRTSFTVAYRTRAFQAEVLSYADGSLVEDSKLNLYNFITLGFNFFL
jgi:hypothetical protein